jgi:hypothetical protein
MKTVTDHFKTSEKTPAEVDSARDGDSTIHHETVPGERSHHVKQDQKRTVDNSGAAVSTTDDDLN